MELPHFHKRRKARRPGRKRVPPGSSPGTLIADPAASAPRMTVMAFGPDAVHERPIEDLAELRALRGRYPVLWLNVDGLGDADRILAIGEVFGLHRLALEDVLSAQQRPKIESYAEHLFLVARMMSWSGRIETDQLSLFLGKDFVVTFQETAGDGFGPVRERIRGGRGLLRHSGPDYLAYALLDAVVDEYFPLLESYGERLESLEDVILAGAEPSCLQDVHAIKRDLLTLRRAVWPLREAISSLLRGEGGAAISSTTRLYLNDCYDHTVQIMDLVETYRELASGLTEMYLTTMSHRLNEVIKVLTIISTIFIPLTFIAGIYGMNFDPDSSPWNMPELRWRFGYLLCLALMAAVAAVLLLYFKRKGWFAAQPALHVPRAPEPPARS